jgi:hypothetical protein
MELREEVEGAEEGIMYLRRSGHQAAMELNKASRGGLPLNKRCFEAKA